MSTYNKHEISRKLASDLAEDLAAANAIDAMRSDSAEIAKSIRQLSESNTNRGDPLVQEYRRDQRAIAYALHYLLDGCHGYKLVPIDDKP